MEYGKISAAFDHGGDRTGELLDFSANISPLGVPEPVRTALRELLDGEDLTRYPDPTAWTLCRRIAFKEGLEVNRFSIRKSFLDSEDYVLCGNGAVDLIYRAVLAMRPKKALVVEPTFSEYKKALALVGCEVEDYLLTADNGFVLTEDFLNALTPDLDILFLCAPNNPTGQNVPPDLLERIALTCKEREIAFFWDASFLDFAKDRKAYRELCRKLVRKQDHVFVLKSFTKLYALPGIRLGYLLSSNNKMLTAMLTAGAPWSVSTVAQTAGVAALSCDWYVDDLREQIAVGRRSLCGALEAMGFQQAPAEGPKLYVPSDANFLLLRTGRPDLASYLEASYGIKVRDCRSFEGLDGNWIRIAVRNTKDNATLLKAFKEVL